ncbi:hypothetical protein CANMA_002972 [Candida margitis]|uniref:uncharacterized protein n=1 Tax=Candida margitis TaxID=1775924 RepID=UPI0022260FF0|nr:uncharacterized protein CANMA_002972 [Candida margitis]KAI5967538.1 hypothetical protein CANMA_002972 [Candida margitis]
MNERGRTSSGEVQFDPHFQIPKGESRTRHSRQGLLHQAVSYRSSSTRSLTQAPPQSIKGQYCGIQRPEFKRWSSYDLPPKATGNSKEISPFTILDDQYNTKHPGASSINLSTDNSFKELEKNTLMETPSKTNLYEKMSDFAYGLASFYSRASPIADDSITDETDEGINDTQYEIESVESQEPQPDLEEIVRNLALQSSETNAPKLNRTQQKLLDFKDLYQHEKNELPELKYDWKIQNETISSQYTTIRLRFSSRQVSSRQVESDVGVLGFIQRHHGGVPPAVSTPVGESDSLLKQIWQDANSAFSE